MGELEELLQRATRQKVKDLLTLEMRKLQTDIAVRQEKLDQSATYSPQEPPAKTVPSVTRRYTKEITTYGSIQLLICYRHSMKSNVFIL